MPAYYLEDERGQGHGPYEAEDIQALVDHRKLDRKDLVFNEDTQQWVTAGNLCYEAGLEAAKPAATAARWRKAWSGSLPFLLIVAIVGTALLGLSYTSPKVLRFMAPYLVSANETNFNDHFRRLQLAADTGGINQREFRTLVQEAVLAAEKWGPDWKNSRDRRLRALKYYQWASEEWIESQDITSMVRAHLASARMAVLGDQ